MTNPDALTPSGKPRLAIFSRHSLIDGRGAGYVTRPGDERGHAFLGAWPHNIGDQFVASGLGRILDFDEFYTITREATPEQFEIVNRECHAVIAVMQNALFPGFFETQLPVSYLKQLKIPVVMFSLGVQFRFGDEIELTPGDIESLKWLHDNAVSSQLRGEISAELLAGHGIDNTRVLGCPSVLWSTKREIKLRPPSLDDVGFTITDMGAIPPLHDYQFSAMRDLYHRSDRFTLIAQGGEFVLQEYLTARDAVHPSTRRDVEIVRENGKVREVERPVAAGSLEPGQLMKSYVTENPLDSAASSLDWYYRDLPEDLRSNIRKRGFFSTSLSDYIRRGRDYSLMVGSRLHGNIMALSQGTPVYYVIHDYRLKEMVEFLKLPHHSFEQDVTVPPIDLESLDYTPFESLMPEIHDGFVDFLEENGLAHKLRVSAPG
ncbi:MAG: hypothetical protein OXR62_03725 [Ahrensia sp.]|nr:hypothetical protein [Ahrensia sp.]